ncbi:tRNA-(ms[2]io[6]A)-hydroxylase [uncultured Flavobacterium sp.]|uniref:tRNA-(ms[2]io[6]A)-hydroxylase n=1 Tax=uncultured Flavobacterium sp. TaxID=165435 RepID=UPI0030EC3256|tara:strand:- start:54502 stop:55083 length:582 start_codon:yes stop_codon:yes gene_type:complete
MFKLKLPTDPRWARIAESNIEEVLTDHAWCEQKAASNCISLITMLPEHTHIITELIKIAQEEMDHFEQVHEIIKSKGWVLGRERKDHYVNELYKFMHKGGSRQTHLVERLLFSAMIEARSCERFKVLSETIDDENMAKFYRDLMVSEANHYTVFINFANEIGEGMDVKKRWEEWLAYEAEIIKSYGKSEAIHG